MDLQTVLTIECVVLIAGTVYAWYNWILVLIGKCETCSFVVHENPFTSKCFWGALFFSLALGIHIWALFLV